MPKSTKVSFDAEYLAAQHLSGDFYNVVKLDENNIAIYIGDVSGHGLSAAMLTVFAHQNIIHLKEKDESTEEIMEPGFVLKTIYKSFNKTNIDEEKYIVMLYGIYNTKNKFFNYSSAGINVAPYIVRSTGKVETLVVRGFSICKLGDFVDPYYKDNTTQLTKGDKIFFYSDGLVEAKNKNGEAYGQAKLKEFLKDNYSLKSSELNIAIKKNFFEFIDYKDTLMDDATFLTMDVKN